jgi:hypothetical protein
VADDSTGAGPRIEPLADAPPPSTPQPNAAAVLAVVVPAGAVSAWRLCYDGRGGFIIEQLGPATTPAAPPPPVPVSAVDKERAILAVVGTEPVSRKALILRAGLKYNSDSRAVVRRLIETGQLAEVGQRVRRPT